MSEANLEFVVTLTRKDVAIARLLSYYRSRLGIVLTAAGVVFGGAFAAQITMHKPYTNASFILPLALLLFVPIAVAFGGLYGPAIDKWLTNVSYVFGEAGFNVSIPSVSANFTWAEVRNALTTHKYVVLSVPSALQIIPLEQLDAKLAESLRELVRLRVGLRRRGEKTE